MADQVPDLLRGWKQIADALGAAESTIRGWMADAADDGDRPPIFKLGAAPNGPVMAERGEPGSCCAGYCGGRGAIR
jgi:hypothetical protein